MRRLSAFLMIAVLVAALVPSAALAAKPITAIDNVAVRAAVSVAPDCNAVWNVYFTGRAYEARITPVVGGVSLAAFTFKVDNKNGQAGFYGPVAGLATYEYTWKAALLDRKGKILGYEVTTSAEKWAQTDACPQYGNLAGWPTWAYEN
jgi:hypothetical protein